MKCLPKISWLISHIHKMNLNQRRNHNNTMFFKILIDIYEDYLKSYDGPLYKVKFPLTV